MTQEKKYRGITRIDSHDTHGWFVRAYKAGKTTSKLFSDAVYGGKEIALKEAITFREELVKKLNDGVDVDLVKQAKKVRSLRAKPVDLVAEANEAMKMAIAPYSKFQVGAALKASSGNVYTGQNIESASFGLSMCAERVALFKALSEGERGFSEIVITSSSDDFCPLCGACRQVLLEFAGNISVIMVNGKGEMKKQKLQKLLPEAFNAKVFEKSGTTKIATKTDESEH
ncbi:cytidine deaminase [Chloroherpeton thalassium ATCC 35110]|uniref:Cytidine deaminase n=1 Tax=Chloroherpeton thalassium (strain ATCC 35110 / GB-78) TaxID=517418 RepID=B3QWK5_CHLT3|nr:cytidine deaminase [Chloroherpeton thalassium]ACF14765.1 cytidine deaminase [Chloroherpeton thalassium ATCC 35110]